MDAKPVSPAKMRTEPIFRNTISVVAAPANCLGTGCPEERSVGTMHKRMASGTQRNQVLFGIITALATKLLVVNLQIQSAAATLTPPAITPQHLLPESFVQLGIKSQAWLFR